MKRVFKNILIIGLINIFIIIILSELILRLISYPQNDCKEISSVGENSVAQFDPELGWSYVPSKSAPGDYGAEYTFSREGYRAADTSQITDFSKPRILLIGDSMLFGHGLSFEQTFGFKLQKILQDKYEVLNFAVQAYGTDQMYLKLNKILPFYKPSIVIIDIGDEHYSRNVSKDRREFYRCAKFLGTKPLLKTIDNKLKLIHKPVLFRFYDNPRLLLFLRNLFDGGLQYRTEKYGQTITKALLSEIQSLVSQQGAKLFIIKVTEGETQQELGNVLGVSIDLASGSQMNMYYLNESDHHPNASGIDLMVTQFINNFGSQL